MFAPNVEISKPHVIILTPEFTAQSLKAFLERLFTFEDEELMESVIKHAEWYGKTPLHLYIRTIGFDIFSFFKGKPLISKVSYEVWDRDADDDIDFVLILNFKS